MAARPTLGRAAALLVLLAAAGVSGFAIPSRLSPLRGALPGQPAAVSSPGAARGGRAPLGLRCAAEGAAGELQGRRAALQAIAGVAAASLAAAAGAEAAQEGARAGDEVLIVGAKGAIGKAVTQLLLRKGCKVRGLTRYPQEVPEGAPADIEWVKGDLNKPATLASVMTSVKRVVYCPGAHAWEDPLNNKRIYDEGVRELLSRAGPQFQRFVYVSSGGITDPPPVDYLVDVWRYKRRGESFLRKSGKPYTILRPYQFQALRKNVDYYGVSQFRDNDYDTIIAVDQNDALRRRQAIFVQDLAEVIAESMFEADAEDKTFNVYNAAKGRDGWQRETWKTKLSALKADKELAKEVPKQLPEE